MLRRLRGFTLLELIVVILILGILATIAVVGYTTITERAQVARVTADLRQLATATMAGDALGADAGTFTRSEVSATLAQTYTTVTDGLSAAGVQLGGVDEAPTRADQFAVAFDHDGDQVPDAQDGDRAFLVSATATGKAYLAVFTADNLEYLGPAYEWGTTPAQLVAAADEILDEDSGVDDTPVLPAAPTLSLTTVADGVAHLSFTGVTGATSYELDPAAAVVDGTTATLTGTAGTTVPVRVRAVTAAGSTDWSAPVDVTFPQLTYASTAFTAGSDHQQLTPTLTGLTGQATYSFTGTLPTGVTFDQTTGVFTGPAGAQWFAPASAGGGGVDYGRSVAVASDGSAIVTGDFKGTATFGPTTLTAVGSSDAFIAKLTPAGDWAWARQTGSSGKATGYGVATSPDGSVLVTGSFTGTATFGGTTTLTAVSDSDVFVAKLTPAGDWAWAKQAGGPVGGVTESGRAVAVAADGSVIVTGSFNQTATFGTITLTTPGGNSGMFVAKLTPAGDWVWAKCQDGGLSYGTGYGVAVAADGSAIVTGTVNETATFGATTLTSAGSYDVLVAKVSPSGAWEWVTRAGSTGADGGYSVATAANGSAIVTGDFKGTATFGPTTLTAVGSSDAFIAKLTPAGDWAWAKQAGGTGADGGYSVATAANGSATVTGNFNGTATFGSATLTAAGTNDTFVAQLTSTGDWAWVQQTGGNSWDYGRGVAVNADGSAFITGYYYWKATFGSAALNSAGDGDVFVAKLTADGTWTEAPALPVSGTVVATSPNGSASVEVTLTRS